MWSWFPVKLSYFITLCKLFFSNSFIALAEKETKFNKNPFFYIRDNRVSSSHHLRQTAVSWNNLMLSVAVVFIAVCLVISLIYFASSDKRKGIAKEKIAFIIVAAIVIFGFAKVVTLMFNIVEKM